MDIRSRVCIVLAAAAFPAAGAVGQMNQPLPPPPGYEERMEPYQLDEQPRRERLVGEQQMRQQHRLEEEQRWRDEQRFRGSAQRGQQFREPYRDEAGMGGSISRHPQGTIRWTMDDWYGSRGAPPSSGMPRPFGGRERQEQLRWESGVAQWSEARTMEWRGQQAPRRMQSQQMQQRSMMAERWDGNRIRGMQEPRNMESRMESRVEPPMESRSWSEPPRRYREDVDRPRSLRQGEIRQRPLGASDLGLRGHQPGSWGPERIRVKTNFARPQRQLDSRHGYVAEPGRVYGTGELPPAMIDDSYEEDR